jgi:hypothetical protein
MAGPLSSVAASRSVVLPETDHDFRPDLIVLSTDQIGFQYWPVASTTTW